jgi:hypothetical protein
MNIIESFISSLLAGIVIILFGGIFSRKLKWILTATMGRILGIDTEFVFKNPRDAEADLMKEITHAKFIKLFTGRGNELQRETFKIALTNSDRKNRKIKILLPLSHLRPDEKDWTKQREMELSQFDHAFGNGVLKDQIDTTIKFLNNLAVKGVVEIKYYNHPHMGRILLTDKTVYFTPYRDDAHGRDCNVIKYRRGGIMYDYFLRYFNLLWEN